MNNTYIFEEVQRAKICPDFSIPARIESELMADLNMNPYTVQSRVDSAVGRWACISSISQRKMKERVGAFDKWNVQVFENWAQIMPRYVGLESNEPPNRAGESIQGYSKKSHYRLMQKFKKIRKKNLPMPFFVTLTYHENMVDFVRAKSDLNTFLQRFRRWDQKKIRFINPDTGRKKTRHENWSGWDGFKYAWKMEPQSKNYDSTGRCAVHFHLMMFVHENSFPKKYRGSDDLRTEYLRMKVSSGWNEIAQPGDNMHLKVGTNVRGCNNWDQATGYLSEYMKKPVDGVVWKDLDTGRFWGFSNNFDITPYLDQSEPMDNLGYIRRVAYDLAVTAYDSYLQKEKRNLNRIRADKKMSQGKKNARIHKIRNRFRKQKARIMIQIEKIEIGGAIAFEMPAGKALQCFTKWDVKGAKIFDPGPLHRKH